MKRFLLPFILLAGIASGSSILFTGNGGGVTKYANFAALPHPCTDGDVAVTIDTGIIYVCESNVWQPSAGPGVPLSLGSFDGNTVDAKGASIAASVLYMQSADATHPGEVNVSTQTFAGQKTFSTGLSGTLTGSASLNVLTSALGNLSDAGTDGIIVTGGTGSIVGTVSLAQHVADTSHNGYLSSTDWNTFSGKQDPISLTTFGSTPNNNGLTLSSNVLNMEPADLTHPGGVSTAAQTFGGSKTFNAATSIAPGSVSLPGLYLSTDTTTGIYRPGVDQFNIGVSGAVVANFGTSGLAVTGSLSATSTVQGTQLISTISTGTAPLTVASTTRVSNLNVATSGQADTVATTQVSSNANFFPLMVASSTNSNQAPDLGTGLSFNPSTNSLSTTTFVGALTGTASGNTTLTPTNHGVVISGSGNAMTATAAGSAGQILRSGGASADPAYSTATYPATATSTGTFLREDGTNFVASGTTIPDTGTSGGILGYTANGVLASSGALTQHAIVLGGGAGATPSVLASLGTSTTVLHGAAAGDPTFGSVVNADIANSTIDLTAKVTGALPIANGGTNNGSLSVSAGAVYYADGSKILALAPGSSGNVLTSGGTSAPTWTSPLVNPMTTGGDIIYGGTAGAATRLANGSASQFLQSAGGTAAPVWAGLAFSPDNFTNLGLSTSVSASAMTIALKQADGSTDPSTGTSAVHVSFRSATATSGLINDRTSTAATSIVIASGATLGQVNGADQYVWVYLMDNSGTLELAVSGVTLFPDKSIQSSTTIGAGSTSGTVLYSTTGRSNLPIRLIGRLLVNQATAGTWTNNTTDLVLAPTPTVTTTDWASFALTIGASTTPPTKGTVSIDLAEWRRVGDSMEIRYQYKQTASGSNGTGTYLFPLNGKTADTNKVTVSTDGWDSTVGAATASNGTYSGPGAAVLYNSTNVAVVVLASTGAATATPGFLSSTLIGLNGTVQIGFQASVPISGWSTYGP